MRSIRGAQAKLPPSFSRVQSVVRRRCILVWRRFSHFTIYSDGHFEHQRAQVIAIAFDCKFRKVAHRLNHGPLVLG